MVIIMHGLCFFVCTSVLLWFIRIGIWTHRALDRTREEDFFWTHYYSHRRHNRRTLVGARTKCEVVDGEDPLDIFHTLAIILFPKKGYSSVRSEEKVIDI